MTDAFVRLILKGLRIVCGALLATFVAVQCASAAPLANLPDQSLVPPTTALPIDGVWRVMENNQLVHINRGRVIALVDYLSLGFQVKTGMVIVGRLRETAPGSFRGDDLGWKIAVTYELREDGVLVTTAHSIVDPVVFNSVPIELADKAWFEEARTRGSAVGGNQSGASDCSFQSYDEKTGKYVCVK